jgi:Flp pilus assembly protein TadG
VRAVRACVRDESGQALVEFALVLPVLLAGLLGILWFGRVMNYNEQATHLVNEAARYAAVGNVPVNSDGTMPASLGAWVRGQAVGELQTAKGDVSGTPTVCLTYQSSTPVVGQFVQITMKFVWHWLPFFKLGTSTTVSQTVDMRLEAIPTGAAATFFGQGCS